MDGGGTARRRRPGPAGLCHELPHDGIGRRVGRARDGKADTKLLLTLVVCSCLCFVAVGEATAQDRWQTLPYLTPFNPVHMALMNNGKLLVVAATGYAAANT